MTLLLTADWHLNDNPRDRYRHDWQRRLHKMIQQYNITSLAMLGDLTDDKDRHSADLVNEIVRHLVELSRLCDVYILKGNHDYEANAEQPFFKFSRYIEGVSWINEPVVRIIKGVGKVLFLPHTRDYETDWKKIGFKNVDMVFTHNTFTGAISESGREMVGIPRDALPRGMEVFSGDVHKPQDSPVIYVGSPYTIRFGDDFDPRVIVIEKGRWRSIPCTGRQKRLLTAHSVDAGVEALKEASGDIVRLRLQLSAKQQEEWPKLKRRVYEAAREHDISLQGIDLVVDSPKRKAKLKEDLTKARTDAEIVKDYCAAHGISTAKETVAQRIVEQCA